MGRQFYKMSGSGNDFVFFDGRAEPADDLLTRDRVGALCERGTGVGADGVVVLERAEGSAFRIRYFNRDGSLAALCGNASLCSVRLAVELGASPAAGFEFETGAGRLAGRLVGGEPEIDLQPVREAEDAALIALQGGERHIGFVLAGVPHLVVLCEDVDLIDVARRGSQLRHHPSLTAGANVNFVSAADAAEWRLRTFERGVEGETLACGTGAVATAIMLTKWAAAPRTAPVRMVTRSGRVLSVTLRREEERWLASLRGEGRIVFQGELREL